MRAIHLGTMGFSYADWVGPFYPAGTRALGYLDYYARCFDTVELDTTFYAIPPVDRVRRWADRVPAGFRFCAKAPRTITHEGAMDRRGDELHRFADVMRAMGEKLAVILLQLPPSAGADQFEALEALLKRRPRDLRLAVEFRNASWGQQRTLDLLREHHCALVAAEYLSRPARIHVTSDFLYLRWVGQHNRFEYLGREQADVEPNLGWWKQEIDRVRTVHPQLRDLFGFFNNDYSGFAVATSRRFMSMMGLAPKDCPVPAEPTLFPDAGASPQP